jgi:fructose-1,6-bisphosphatase-3
VPVKVAKGESPVKANGKLLVIDGGFAKVYQQVTGIAGYTLIYNSQGLLLSAHQPFVSKGNLFEDDADIISHINYIERAPERIIVGLTDVGSTIRTKIADIEKLLEAYQSGFIKEKI